MTIRNLDHLLRPRAVAWLGQPQDAAQQALFDKLRPGAPLAPAFEHWAAGLPAAAVAGPRLVVLSDEQQASAERFEQLCALGCRAVLWALPQPPSPAVLAVARRHTLRLLGPRSIGLAHGGGPDVSTLAQSPLPGSLALIVQSQSVAAAAADWAAGRRIGFSWIAASGGESDVDVADLLDYAAVDPHTQAVAVEVGKIRGARKFMSAARACARAKPTVILQTRLADRAAAGADPVRSAAFARAGMVEVADLPGLFDAIAALQRLPVVGQPRVLVVANGAALCALSADAVLREQLQLVELDRDRAESLRALLPAVRFRPGTVDIGEPDAAQTVAALRRLLEWRDIDALLFVRSPVAGYPHLPLAGALVQARLDPRLLCVWLGLETAAPARRVSADAGQATFTSPQAAARAIRYRWEYSRNRELLTQTPPRSELPSLDAAAAALELRRHLDAGTDTSSAAALDLLRAYGLDRALRSGADTDVIGVRLERHPELGMHLRVQLQQPGSPAAYGFVPLDELLAGRLLEAAGCGGRDALSPAAFDSARRALIRLSQLALDQPEVERLDAHLIVRGTRVKVRRDARAWLTPLPVSGRERLALAPYPSAQVHQATLGGGRRYDIRPVRPDDEPAVIRLLESLDAEAVRLRFFAYIRHFGHAMAARMTQIDYDRELALVVHESGSEGRLRAIGTLICDPDGVAAEFALLVHQDCARQGLGRHLLTRFVEHGRSLGLERIWGVVLAENDSMLGLARRLGFTERADPEEPGCRRVELRLVSG